MRKRVFLHIGTQKTGTSAIQEALHENRAALTKWGFEYPATEPDDPNAVSHYNSFRGFFSRSAEQVDATRRFINRIRQAPRNLILSAECLSAWPPRPVGEHWHQTAARKRKIVHEIRNALPDHDPTVIIFTRNVPDFMESLYKQHLRSSALGDSVEAYEQFLSECAHLSDFETEIAIWQSITPDVRRVDYDRMESSVFAFCDLLGIPRLQDRRVNVS